MILWLIIFALILLQIRSMHVALTSNCNHRNFAHKLVRISIHRRSFKENLKLRSTNRQEIEDIDGLLNRRKHKNKYQHLSNKAVDPLSVAISNAKETVKRHENENRITGTTVPTASGSNGVRLKANRMTANYSPIDMLKVVPSDPSTFGYTEIGHIIGPHGVKGELKIELNTDFADYRVRNGTILYLKKPNRRSPRPVQVLSSRKIQQDMYLIYMNGIRNRLTASALQKYLIFVRSDDRPTLEEEEYLLRDIVGLRCYASLEDLNIGKYFAKVEGVVPPDELVEPALRSLMHSVLELRLRGTDRFCLIPFVPSIVTAVLISDNALIIESPKGLLDLTYEAETKVVIRGYLPSRIHRLSDLERMILMEGSTRLFPEGGIVLDD